MPPIIPRITWVILLLLTLLVVLATARYYTLDPEVYFPEQRATYLAKPVALYTHITGGIVAMLLGPWQFLPALRRRWPRAHRVAGRLYLLACLAGALGGLALAPTAHGGWVSATGFALLAFAWLATGYQAYQHARARRIPQHRAWMIRSFALTLAALTLRLYLVTHGILLETGVIALPFTPAYTAIAWLCWLPNLAVAELYLHATKR